MTIINLYKNNRNALLTKYCHSKSTCQCYFVSANFFLDCRNNSHMVSPARRPPYEHNLAMPLDETTQINKIKFIIESFNY